MIITLQNTDRIVRLNGVPARIWEGATENGIPVVCFITRVAVKEGHDSSQFDRELQACAPPTADTAESFPIDLRLAL